MLTPYESRLGLMWLANAAGRIHHRRPEAAALAEWVNEQMEALAAGLAGQGCGIDAAGLAEAAAECQEEGGTPRNRVAPEAWRRLRAALRQASDATQAIQPDPTVLRLQRLAQITRLDAEDLQVVEMALRYQTQPALESLVDDVYGVGPARFSRRSGLSLKSPAFAELLGISANTLLLRCAPDAPLARSGLLAVDDDGDVSVASRVRRLDSAPDQETDPLPLLLGSPAQPELEWQDFDHLGQQRADVEGIVRGALSKRAKGVNVLLYGPPGTGQDAVCPHPGNPPGRCAVQRGRDRRKRRRALAQRATCGPQAGAEPAAEQQRRHAPYLTKWTTYLAKAPSSLSGLFGFLKPRSSSRAPSRLFMNRLLEENPAPTLWTANDARDIDRAILRRMMFAIELRQPPPPVRQRIWARQLERSGIKASPEDARALAYEFDATPGVAAGAVSAAALLRDGDLGAVRRGVQSLSRLLDCEKPDQGVPRGFDPAFMKSDEDLESAGRPGCALPASRGFRYAFRGLPAPERAPGPATWPTVWAWKSSRNAPRT